jgi:hypothetical protein
MRGFYFKDKRTNVAFRGFQPTTDIFCLPFDYSHLGYAYNSANIFQNRLKVKCPIPIPDDMVRQFVLHKTDEMIAEKLAKSAPNPAIHQILTEALLYKRTE